MTEPWSSLKHQSRSRELTSDEAAFAHALEAIYLTGVGDFQEVAKQLTARAVVAPASRATQWDLALLVAELEKINKSLDEAYARNGIGA